MNRTTVIGWSALLLIAALPAPLASQETDGGEEGEQPRPNVPVEMVDRVAAVVGDTVVLYTEILEALLQRQAQGETLPPPGSPAFDSLTSSTLDFLVDQLVLLQQAEQEDITVADDVIEAETDRRFREVRGSFPSASDFEAAIVASGRTLIQYRLFLRAQVRAQLMIRNFWQSHGGSLPPVSISDEEVREWFEQNARGETRPPLITFEQVLIKPEPSEAAETAARERAEQAMTEIRQGVDFEVAARKYSEDPANRDQGGDLGWVRRSEIDPDFARAAWAARTGTPIGPVRSQFGYHIIKVENVRGGERKIRHILVRPEIDQADAERARELAAAVADSARNGVPIRQLARKYGVQDAPVRLPDVELSRLADGGYGEYLPHLSTPVPGEIVGPFDVSAGGLHFVVLKVIEFSPQGPVEFEDVQEDIREGLAAQKGRARFVEGLRNETFVDIKL